MAILTLPRGMLARLRSKSLAGYGSAFAKSHSSFPLFTEFHAALEHIRLGLLKAPKDAATLNYIARLARGHEVGRVLLPLAPEE